MDKFEEWFQSQDFYTNLRFIHGDALFLKDGDVYRVLVVRTASKAWQEQQKRVDELSQENEKLRLDHAAYKKSVKNIIREKIKQIEGRDFTVAAMSRSLVLANAKVDELQAKLERLEVSELRKKFNEAYSHFKNQTVEVMWSDFMKNSHRCIACSSFDVCSCEDELEQSLKGGEV